MCTGYVLYKLIRKYFPGDGKMAAFIGALSCASGIRVIAIDDHYECRDRRNWFGMCTAISGYRSVNTGNYVIYYIDEKNKTVTEDTKCWNLYTSKE